MTVLDYDAIVLGAGAAGLMCAATAGQRGRRVLLLDHADQVGKKILISGGGRCNVTNAVVTERDFAGSTAPAIRRILARFDVAAARRFFGELEVELKEEAHGKLFPVTDRARTVLESEGGVRLTAHAKANDPVELSFVLRDVVREASWGYVNYEIVDVLRVDGYPRKVDGFRYDDASFLAARQAQEWQPAPSSYRAMFEENGLIRRFADEGIRELWLWGASGMHFDEFAGFVPNRYARFGPTTANSSSARPISDPSSTRPGRILRKYRPISTAIGMVANTVEVAHGLCFIALTTTSPSTAIRMIMMVSVPRMAANPPTGPSSSRAIWPRLRPLRRVDRNKMVIS